MSQSGNTFDTAEPMLNDVLDEVHKGVTQLPDFQRGWVWDDEHIRALLASISLSYPIGAGNAPGDRRRRRSLQAAACGGRHAITAAKTAAAHPGWTAAAYLGVPVAPRRSPGAGTNREAARLDDILSSRCIDPALLRADKSSPFIRSRAIGLLDLIERTTGRPVAGRDHEEVVKVFQGPLVSAG